MALIYARAIGSALGEGLMTAAWVAAGELPTRRRRLARAGAVASVIALGVARYSRDTPAPDATASELAEGQETQDASKPLDARRVALTLAFGGLSVGMMVGRRHLEKRWLTRLEAKGHEHPHRALALRVGLLAVATSLPGKVLSAAQAARHKPVDLDQG